MKRAIFALMVLVALGAFGMGKAQPVDAGTDSVVIDSPSVPTVYTTPASVPVTFTFIVTIATAYPAKMQVTTRQR